MAAQHPGHPLHRFQPRAHDPGAPVLRHGARDVDLLALEDLAQLLLVVFTRVAWYRKSTARDQTALAMRIRNLAHARPRFGYQRIKVLLRRKGCQVNRKRGLRPYRPQRLQVTACQCGGASIVPSSGSSPVGVAHARVLEHRFRPRYAVRRSAISGTDGRGPVMSPESLRRRRRSRIWTTRGARSKPGGRTTIATSHTVRRET